MKQVIQVGTMTPRRPDGSFETEKTVPIYVEVEQAKVAGLLPESDEKSPTQDFVHFLARRYRDEVTNAGGG